MIVAAVIIVAVIIVAAVVIPAVSLVHDDLTDSTPAVPAVIVTAIDVEKCHRPVTVMYPILRTPVVPEPLDPDQSRRWPFNRDDPTRLGIAVRDDWRAAIRGVPVLYDHMPGDGTASYDHMSRYLLSRHRSSKDETGQQRSS